jgi:uncharacterized circularly permuted ATP-grasp superfamily protein
MKPILSMFIFLPRVQAVEGSDLLVREGYVWLKTIDQLERVDIIKRIDDQWCDPLELNKSSLESGTITSNAFRKCVCY